VVSLGIFSVVPPTEPCALRSTQPLKMSTRDFSWGKGGRCLWLTTYHPCSAEMSRKSGALIYPEPLGSPRLVAEDLYFKICQGDLFCTEVQRNNNTSHDRAAVYIDSNEMPFGLTRWLRHSATWRKVAAWIADGVTANIH